MKIKTYPHGHATMERQPSGLYLVQCYVGADLRDKVRCDDYRTACEYFRAFCAIARAA